MQAIILGQVLLSIMRNSQLLIFPPPKCLQNVHYLHELCAYIVMRHYDNPLWHSWIYPFLRFSNHTSASAGTTYTRDHIRSGVADADLHV